MRNRYRRAALAVAIGSLLGGIHLSFAQEAALATSQELGRGEDKVSEVVVTAERKEEPVSKVPISITALTQKTMDDLSIRTVADLATIVPGMALSPSSPGAQDNSDIAIRGITNFSAAGTAPTTQLYIDETPIATRELATGFSKSPFPQIFDLDRVEVLRGPQGTLFGASAMGGAIRFITPQPDLNTSSGSVKADLSYTEDGSRPNYEVGVAYGAPIVAGKAGIRVSAWFQSLGGFIDREDPYTGQIVEKDANISSAYVIRPAFTWAPTEALTITPALFWQHQHNQSPDSYSLSLIPNPEDGRHVWLSINQPATDDLKVPSLTIRYDFSGLSFTSDTSYLDREASTIEDVTQLFEVAFGGGPAYAPPNHPELASFVSYGQNLNATHAWQQQFRLTSQQPSARTSWVVGAYFRHAVQDQTQLIPSLTQLTEAIFGLPSEEFFGVPDTIYNGQALSSYYSYQTTDVSTAGFGELSAELTRGLKVAAGVRVERVAVENQRQFASGPLAGVADSAASQVVLADAVATPVTPRFSLTYQYTDKDMVYISAAKGFRPGGGNPVAGIAGNPLCEQSLKDLGLSSVPTSFDPDSLWNYELGTKNLLFDRRLSIAGSVYYIKWTNIQTGVSLPSCFASFTGNRGEVVSKGFDLELTATITQDLRLHALVGYTDAYYPHTLYGAPPTNPPGPPPLLHAEGDKFGFTPPWTVAVNAEYSHSIDSLRSGVRAYLRADYRWLDGLPAGNPLSAGYDPVLDAHRNPAYGILNVRLGVRNEAWDVSAYVSNATHADPQLGYFHFDPLIWASALRPFTFGVTTWYRF